MTEQDIAEERRAQSVLRFLSTGTRTTEEVATHLGLDNVEALVLLRAMSQGRRVADVTSFSDRAENRRVWTNTELPLPG